MSLKIFVCPFCEEYSGSAKNLRSHIKVCKNKDIDDDDNLKDERRGEKRRKNDDEEEEEKKESIEKKGEKEKEKGGKTENILSAQTLPLPTQPLSSSPSSPSSSASFPAASSFSASIPSFFLSFLTDFPAIPTVPPPNLSTERERARNEMEHLFIDCLSTGDTGGAVAHFRNALECSSYYPTCVPFALTLRGLRAQGCAEFGYDRIVIADYGLSDAARAALLTVPTDKLETVFRFLKVFKGSLATFDEDFQEYLKKQHGT